MKHLLKLMDLSGEEIMDILNLADQLKYEKKHGIRHPLLEGQSLGMIFQKSSTRTRVSFEVGMYDLGGQALFLSSRDLQIGRGEPAEDTARVLSRFLDGIMIRTFAQSEVETLAEYGSIPVINGLTDYCHPCQVLADLMTVREHKGLIKGNKLCFIGDGNNMANSLIVGGIKTGMPVSIACPKDHQPDAALMKWASENGDFLCTESVEEAAAGADVRRWDRRARRRRGSGNSPRTRSTKRRSPRQIPAAWCSIVFPHTAGRRSPPRRSRRTRMRSSTRRRIASTHRRRFLSAVWRKTEKRSATAKAVAVRA